MTENRKKEIINVLLNIYDSFEPYKENSPDGSASILVEEPTMYWLISTYTNTGQNKEQIGGVWVREHIPELADLPY